MLTFLKQLCCKETLTATIITGDIKTICSNANPMLEIHIQLSMGGINPSTDFLYLQPQTDVMRDPHNVIKQGTALSNEKTTGSTFATNASQHYPEGIYGGPEDREVLPRRLRDVLKERVILI